jgi:hypothetical protein
MRKILLLLVLLAVPGSLRAQTAADSAAIRATSLDYIDGWFTGDSIRMARALHPDLAKREVATSRATSQVTIGNMTAAQLTRSTGMGGGKRMPAGSRREDVVILDMFQNSASVRIDAGVWIDYLHLARIDGAWKIVNVLWEVRK